MRAHQIEISRLCRRTRADDARGCRLDGWLADIARGLAIALMSGKPDFRIDLSGADSVASFRARIERRQNRGGALARFRGAFDGHQVSAHIDAHVDAHIDAHIGALRRT